MYAAGVLHDLGKVCVSEHVLHKPVALNVRERAEMRAHVTLGEIMVAHITGDQRLARIVGEHHERVDGGGYPRGLRANELDPLSLVLTVADAYTAMMENRPYARVMSQAQALEDLLRCSGTQFNDEVVQALLVDRVGAIEANALRAAS